MIKITENEKTVDFSDLIQIADNIYEVVKTSLIEIDVKEIYSIKSNLELQLEKINKVIGLIEKNEV